MKFHRTWLEARIILSRLNDCVDDEDACRQIAERQGVILNEDAIEREVIARQKARERWNKRT